MTTIIAPRIHDLGDGFMVRRAVPSIQARSVGPFVFVDHMGPATFAAGNGIDVRPHPHIGLATVTYLWQGAIRHKDTLGSDIVIEPGAVNWMTAGRGIAHSERTPSQSRAHENAVHGMQTWVALPKEFEEVLPEFHHHAASALPQWHKDGVWGRVIAGRGFGEESPAKVYSDTFNVALDLDADAELDIDPRAIERAIYILEGAAQLDGADVPEKHLIVLDQGTTPRFRAKTPLKALLIGGDPLDAPRHMWWNFVSSSQERIEQAKQDWLDGKFGLPHGENEYIPLPNNR